MAAGGIGDGQELLGTSSIGTPSKNTSSEHVVTSPVKKKSCNLGEFMQSISESIATKTSRELSRERRRNQEQEDQKEVMQILLEDGVDPLSDLYFMALDLFRDPACRAQFKNLPDSACRLKYIEWTWHQNKAAGNQ
ncbi:unnamed protein product [Urochloa humidicola]